MIASPSAPDDAASAVDRGPRPPRPSDGASSGTASRLPALDSTRGLAMVLVCLSHFTWSATQTLGDSRLFRALMTVAMVASPTFILVSGITLGYVRSVGGRAYRAFALKVRERGLLLVTVVHLLMMPTFYFMAAGRTQTYRFTPITTTIGVCLLLGPTFVNRLDGRRRAAFGALLIACSWVAVFLTSPVPDGSASNVVKDALVGARERSWWFFNYPIVPWFGAYLLGATIGQSLHAAARRGESVAALLLRWALGFVGAAVAVEAATVALAALRPDSVLFAELATTVGNPMSKVPPSPAYLCAYGSAGLALTAAATLATERGRLRWLMRRTSEVGRSSLSVFVMQSYLYYLVELHWIRPTHAWPLWYFASLALLLAFAQVWLAAGGNELLRIPGFAPLHARLSDRGAARRAAADAELRR